ncbi:small ribosomal subunit protein mS80 (rPPR6)-like [Euphorbia lathyris]|uniref:small ribosomal subunit protein mS80 (rPPR6)-like n=1 Tax=Euphorbia lathyris TaxID=212925 RepID=UPI003313D5AE
MWRSIAAKSRHVAKNLGAVRNFKEVSSSHTLSQSSFQCHLSKSVSSESLLPHQNLRFLSNSSVNPSGGEIEHSLLDSSPNGDNDAQSHQFAPINDFSAVDNSGIQLWDLETKDDLEGLPEQFSEDLSEYGDVDKGEIIVTDIESAGMSERLSIDLVGEGDVQISGEGEEEGKVYEIDAEKLEELLSLLQSRTDGSLESNLDSMNLNLHEELVLKVLETPLVLGDNLIRFFKWAIQNSDISVTTCLVDALVRAICSDLKKKNAYALWDLVSEIAQKDIAVVNSDILNQLIATLSKLGKGKAALEVFDKFGEFGCVPDSDTFYYTIEALCRRSIFDSASSVCLKMLDAEALPDSQNVGKIICWLSKGGKANDAHMVYLLAKEKNKYPPRSAVNFLISLLCQKNETVKLAVEMLDDISVESQKYAINPFSSVVRGLCRIKDFDTAKMLLSKMIDEGPPPGNAVFNSIINGYSKCGDMKEALEMKKLMQNRGLKPDLFAYTVIMSGYVSGGQMEEACEVFSEAKKMHSKLTPVTYHTLIRGYCKLEQFDKALDLLAEMKNFGVRPNVDEYNKLIQSLCLKGLDWEKAEKLLEKMKEDGLHLSGITKGLIRAVKELEEEGLEKGISIEAAV